MALDKKILAVDDDRLVRMSVKKILEGAGYSVVLAASGEEAIEIFPKDNFDLVLTDIRMPGMDGLATLRALREVLEYSKKPRIPEIVITAYNDKNVIEEAKKMGVAKFLFKPFDINDFLDTVKTYL